MIKKIFCRVAFVTFTFIATASFAQVEVSDVGLGQTIQIRAHLNSFVGNPSWLLVIRDIDHNQNIPYLFDVRTGNNYWVAFTYGRNYLIEASTLQFSPYRINPYCYTKTHNFCKIESNGAIIRGRSMIITIEGSLAPNTNAYQCHVSSYSDSDFTIATSNA